MGYFDGLTSGSFKTTGDGRRLFFPWGVLGGGYAIASEAAYQRLRQQVKAYMVVTLVLVIASGLYEPYRAPLAAAALLVAFYLAWMWRVLPHMERSDEKLSDAGKHDDPGPRARPGGVVVAGDRLHHLCHLRYRDLRIRSRQPAYRPFLHGFFRTLCREDCAPAHSPAPHVRATHSIAAGGGNRGHSGSFRWDRRAACGIKTEPRKFGAA